MLWGGGVENILIFRFDAIGDMILTTGFIREVRKNFPKAHITLIAYSEVFAVIEICPYLNEVLSINRGFFGGNFLEVLERIAVFCRDNLWQKKFSIAFSPRWDSDTLPGLMLAWMSGARERIGYGAYPFTRMGDPPPYITEQNNFFLTKKIVTPKEIMHDAAKDFYLLAAAGFKVNETHMELWYSAEDFQHTREILENIPSSTKKVLLGLGASETNRKYPVEMYLVALRELAKKDLVFVIVGGKSEINDANFIEQNLPPGRVLNLAGKTNLRETMALVKQVDFYLGNVTGVMHMAAAAQIPCLMIYREAPEIDIILLRGSEFERFAPWQTKAIVLRPARRLGDCANLPPVYGGCRHREPHCITQITPQQIVDGFEKLQTL